MGIVSLHTYVPCARLTAREISLSSGVSMEVISQKKFTEKPVHSKSAPILDMGIKAAKRLLEQKAIDLSEVGMLVHASSGVHDYQAWSPAARLQSELSLPNAFCFDIANGCNAGSVALQIVSQALSQTNASRYGLVVVCDAISRLVDHCNPDHAALFNFADAATAILIDREPNGPRIVSHFNATEGSFSEYMRQGPDAKFVYQAGRSKSALKAAYVKNYTKVIGETMIRGKRRIEDLAHVLMSQGDPQLFEPIASLAGFDEKKIFRSSENLGHLAGSDVFLALEQLLSQEKLKRGDLVLLATSAFGFSWGAVLLEI